MSETRKDKRILIISNACFSDSDSNGRTLAKLFQNFDKQSLAQFYVYGNPDFAICENYYRVTDGDALKSIIKWKETGGQVDKKINPKKKSVVLKKNKVKKTPFSMLMREFAWYVGRWRGYCFWHWVGQFKPEVIFLSLGDNVFLCHLAKKIALQYNIPIYVYSTENYCFKKYNYVTKRPSLFYWLFYWLLNYSYHNIEQYVKLGIFNTPLLTKIYEQKFSFPCKCIFSPSDIEFVENTKIPDEITVSYLGNLGVGRHVPLIELASVLAEIKPGCKLDIYGKLPNDKIAAKKLTECKNINYKGFVTYKEVIRIIHKSTLLVHAELNNEFYSEDLRYAFSTKIADSICSGTPFMIYARTDLAETDFLIKNKCAFVASDLGELREKLIVALNDENERKQVVKNATIVRNEYFTRSNVLREILNN